MASILAKRHSGAWWRVLRVGLALLFLKNGACGGSRRWLELEKAKIRVNIAFCDKLKSQI